MTGAQTDRVSVPKHVTASAVLLRLAHPFFHAGHFGADDPDRPLNYGIWLSLRETAHKLLDRRALELNYNEAKLLDSALNLCPQGEDVQYLRSLQFTERG